MHFDILVEDLSGKEALNVLVPKIKADKDTFSVKSYKGVGHLPKDLKVSKSSNSKRVLLNNLPKLIQGYGKTCKGYPAQYQAAYGSAKVAYIPAKYDEANHGTWEQPADIIFKSGAAVLSAKGWPEIGEEKSKWARNICPHLDITKNTSPSFICFRDTLQSLADQ